MIFIILLSIAIVIVDQVSKLFITGFFFDPHHPLFVGMLEFEGDSVTLIDNFFSFTYVLNDGAAFGILRQQRLFFLLTTIIVCVVGIILLLRLPKKHILLKLSSGFILGGAIGNMIDRVFIGVVRDFIDVTLIETLFDYSFPVFNVADIFVVVGVIMLSIYIMFIHEKIYIDEEKQADG